jgi:NADH dehydrogenase FAD-containing subunit
LPLFIHLFELVGLTVFLTATGIEFSAELHDIITEDMAKLYPRLMPYVNISVYDVAPSVLSMFDKKLGEYAVRTLQREKINILTSHHVEELSKGPPRLVLEQLGKSTAELENACFTLKTTEAGEMGVGMCVWSTGLTMNPFIQEKLTNGIKKHPKTGAVLVDDKLRVTHKSGNPVEDIFALGDCAAVEGMSYPATAQVANQEAIWLAKRLNKQDLADPKTPGFQWKNMGVMAYLGNWNALLQRSGGDVSGRFAWFLWRSAYLTKAVSWRNKVLIPLYWFINWAFGRDTSRF